MEKRNGGLVLTDDGYTIADLEATGMSFETDKRKAHLQSILSGFGVRLENKVNGVRVWKIYFLLTNLFVFSIFQA